MKFEYEAIPIKGKNFGNTKQRYRGIVEAPTGELAIIKLFQRKLYPLSLKSLSQRDINVATRLNNYNKLKAEITTEIASAMPVSSAAPRFRMPWKTIGYYLAWGAGIATVLWALSRI